MNETQLKNSILQEAIEDRLVSIIIPFDTLTHEN